MVLKVQLFWGRESKGGRVEKKMKKLTDNKDANKKEMIKTGVELKTN